MAQFLSVNVGLPKDIRWKGRTVHTAVWKNPATGKRMVRRLNIDGDGQGDLAGHGGEQRAVLVYQMDSYRYWERHLGRSGFTYGQFGENFTVDGLPDEEVCVGDRYRIGGALFEVTQPRVTCYRVGIRMAEPQMAALPGQFITVRLHPEASRPPLLRSYSLSGSPGEPCYRISVKQEPHGAASRYLRDRVGPGVTIEVAAPRGAFVLRPGAAPVVLLSAGIGATPVLAMLHDLAGQAATRQVWWVHGARNGDEHPFAQEAGALLRALPDVRRYIAYSRPSADDRPGVDFDAEGHADIEAVQAIGVPRDADFYLCGPDGFMRDLTEGLAAWGVPPARVRTETFGPAQSITPGVIDHGTRHPHPPPGPAGTGPQVSFGRSGVVTDWRGGYSSLLELAEACDVAVRWSCRTGVCHTCVTGVLAGAVAYQPEPLENPAEGSALICCARPETDVVLDL